MLKTTLLIGDKILLKSNNEPGEIIQIIDTENAVIEFFDEILELNANEVKPYKLGKNYVDSNINFHKVSINNVVHSEDTTHKTPNFIDLHIEKITKNHLSLNHDQILRKQLSALNNYLFKAIEQKKFSVTIIHGKGAGVLRTEVLKMVKNTFGLNTMGTKDMGKTEVKINNN